MRDLNAVMAHCRAIGCACVRDVPMRDHTTFKIGGAAELFAAPSDSDMLCSLLRFVFKEELPYFVLGNGSNLLVSDSGVRGLVISTAQMDQITFLNETTIRCESGVPLIRVCRLALAHELTGLEFAYGIPGSAGGAAYMNAGAYDGEMKDVLVSCEHVEPDGRKGSLSGEKLALRYRGSAYSDGNRVISALILKLRKGDPAQIRSKMEELMARRREKQPLEYPSAGSTFKRPQGYFAGALIEQCGLKGYRIGDAQVSEKHAGFVINRGNASADEVKELMAHCRQTVLSQTGVLLEPEVKMIGD